jgi:Zn-dependent peptidase ImmA (M78 family)
MDDDFKVKALSNAETRNFAKKLREYFGVTNNRWIDVLALAKRPSIWTVNGERKLNLEIRPDIELPNAEGITTETDGVVTIRIRQSIHYGAYMGDGRPRNTFSHEFAHAALGHGAYVRGAQLARRPSNNLKPKWLPHYESAEHQAKIFAPAFLINDSIAETLSSAEEIAVEFGISLASAEIYFEQLTEKRDQEDIAARVGRMAIEVRQMLSPPKNTTQIHFMNEPCPICGQQKLIPIAAKFMCLGCDHVSDHFQDGDAPI